MTIRTLAFDEAGSKDAPPIVFLHGLLGSRRNWRSVAKDMSTSHRVFSLDLRNHGDSFHDEEGRVSFMVDDLRVWADGQGLGSFVLCGHSLGGKIAMKFACLHGARVQRLVVVDIAPRDYPPDNHLSTFDGLLALNLQTLSSHKDADLQLMKAFPNWAFRKFLLTNLSEESGVFGWKPNLCVLRSSLPDLSRNPLTPEESYGGVVSFVNGGKSSYVCLEDEDSILRHFPKARTKVLPEAGHFVHAEDKPGFLSALRET
ncbi:MAG: alpha/beta hydrolase [Opitutae bacterium]|nr:alpha/beta hydrolase [Opitutae bacterium]